MLIDITKEDLEQIMKLFPITSKWLNMLAEEERIHNDFMKKAQEIIGNSLCNYLKNHMMVDQILVLQVIGLLRIKTYFRFAYYDFQKEVEKLFTLMLLMLILGGLKVK